MNMTRNEIIREYRNAKRPMTQIGILADENECTRKEIAAILIDAGETVPGIYTRQRKPRKPADPDAEEGEKREAFVLETDQPRLYLGTTVGALIDALQKFPQDAIVAEGFDTIRMTSDIDIATGKSEVTVSIGRRGGQA